MAKDHDLTFEELMAQQGVQPMGRSSGPRSPKPPAPSTAAARPPPPPAVQDQALAEAQAVAAALRQRALDLEARLATAEATALASEAAVAAAAAAELEARDLAEQALDALRTGQERDRTALETTLASRTSMADVLLARGCASDIELLEVCNGLLLQRPKEFLEAIVLADPHGLARVLAERVAFVGFGVPFTPDANTVLVRVSSERCELTGGTDLGANFHGFVEACTDAGVARLVLVGGSPAYRKQIERLAAAHPSAPRFDLVSGTRRREKRKAEADMRGADLVVIWGATELDHSVTAGYHGGPARVIRIAHRGLAGMLQLVRTELRRPRVSGS